MSAKSRLTLLVAVSLALALAPAAFGRGARGGGSRGGGFSRSASRSGRGTVRYSGGSRSSFSRSPSSSRRPSTPSVSRPSPSRAPAVSRPSTGFSSRPANVGSIRHSTSSYRSVQGSFSGQIRRPVTPGDPGKRTAEGPRGGELTVGRGPGGGGGAHYEGPGGGERTVVRGPGGTTGRHVEGPGGGEGTLVRGPRGGGAGYAEGPRGGEAGFVRGPGGRGAAAARGPYGGAVGGVWGRHGHGYVRALPRGYVRYDVGDVYFFRVGWWWYRPYYRDGTVVYVVVPPPTGVVITELPPGYRIIVVNGQTYYYVNDTYYIITVKESKQIYMVMERPKGAPLPAVTSDKSAPNPFDVLKKMSDHLASLKQFRIDTRETLDEILDSGQKVQLATRRAVSIRRPDRVAADVKGDHTDRRVTYDGKTLLAHDRSKKAYAVVQMPNTIEATLDKMAKDFGMAIPLADFVYPNAYEALIGGTQSGRYVGLHRAGVFKCHHMAFTGDAVDWELWVQEGDKPLPRRLVITYKQQPGKPRYVADLTKWDTSPTFAPDLFTVTPPQGAQKIEIMPVTAADAAVPTPSST